MENNLTKERVLKEARAEVEKEIVEKYKGQYKTLLKQKAAAELVVKNIDREIEDLELKINNEL